MLKNFGEDLKKIREGKKITLQEVALKTRFGIHIFEKMEGGDFSFEIPTYIRAYLKQYAIAIDENPDKVLKDFDLAKIGKYQARVFEEVKIAEVPKIEEKKEEKQEEKKEEPKQISKVETPKKEEPAKQEEVKPHDKTEKKTEPVELKKSDPIKHRATNDDKSKQTPQRDYSINIAPKSDVRESSFKMDSSIMKSLMIILFILLGGAGLYFLVTSLFTGKGEVEIVRQNFDEIVQENEKNILGKKTPAEIADSIRKAEEEARLLASSQSDSLTLVIRGKNYGEIIIVPDSVGIKTTEVISFGKNDSAKWRASKFFLITTSNSDAFEAVLNGKTLVFDRKRFRNLVINKDGIVPQTGGTTTRTRTTQDEETPQTNRRNQRNNGNTENQDANRNGTTQPNETTQP